MQIFHTWPDALRVDHCCDRGVSGFVALQHLEHLAELDASPEGTKRPIFFWSPRPALRCGALTTFSVAFNHSCAVSGRTSLAGCLSARALFSVSLLLTVSCSDHCVGSVHHPSPALEGVSEQLACCPAATKALCRKVSRMKDEERARAIMLGCCAAVATVVAIASLLNRFGVFDRALWAEGEFAGCTVVYVEHTGPYDRGLGEAFAELVRQVKKKAGIDVSYDTSRFFGAHTFSDPVCSWRNPHRCLHAE